MRHAQARSRASLACQRTDAKRRLKADANFVIKAPLIAAVTGFVAAAGHTGLAFDGAGKDIPMTVINTNTSALRAQNGSRVANMQLQTAMERLSTGKRNNSAEDDAARLAIAHSPTSQHRGMKQGISTPNAVRTEPPPT